MTKLSATAAWAEKSRRTQSAQVEVKCLITVHTAGVTSSKLVPPTKIINNINGSTPLTGDWQYSASIADAQGESDRGFAAASVSSSKLRYLNLPDLP